MLQPLLQTLNGMRVILATGSKQRQEVLAKTAPTFQNLKFEVQASDFEENLDQNEYSVSEYVEQTALGKAQKVYEELKDDIRKPDLVIGLDTMVCCEGKMFGKPRTKDEAIDIVRRLTCCKSPHVVYTGVVLMFKDQIIKFTETTSVYMDVLTEEEIVAYVETGEPIGKAGAYAIQGLASSFVKRIEGDYYNVIGLPLCRITSELKKLISK